MHTTRFPIVVIDDSQDDTLDELIRIIEDAKVFFQRTGDRSSLFRGAYNRMPVGVEIPGAERRR